MIIDLLSSSFLKNILNPTLSSGVQIPWVDPAKLPAPEAKVSEMLDAVAGTTRGIAGDVAAAPPAFSVKNIPPETQANPGEALREVAKPPETASAAVSTPVAWAASTAASNAVAAAPVASPKPDQPVAPKPEASKPAPEKPAAKTEPTSDLPKELRDKGWTDDNWKDFKQLIVMSSQDMLAKAYDRTMQALRG